MYLSDPSRILAGILLLSLITVESGGLYLIKLVGGKAPATPFQLGFARAGHAHAGVLLILSLVIQVYVDGSGIMEWMARSLVPIAALLMPAGFFFSSMGAGRTEPNKLIALVWAGAVSLAVGLATLGIGLLVK